MSVEYRGYGAVATELSLADADYSYMSGSAGAAQPTTPHGADESRSFSQPRSRSAGRARSASRGRERTTPGKGIVPATHLPSLLTPGRVAAASIPLLSELDDTQRDRCWQMLLEDNEAIFHVDGDGLVVATVHFNADEWSARRSTAGASAASPAYGRPSAVSNTSLASYPRRSTSAHSSHSRPDAVRPLPWLSRLINEIYDARFLSYTYEAPVADDAGDFEPLSAFAYSHITKKFGLESLVSAACQDLIRAVSHYRKDSLEVETFALFLSNQFDAVELMFYLFARSRVFTALSDDTPAILRRPTVVPLEKTVPLARAVLARQPPELLSLFAHVLQQQVETAHRQGKLRAGFDIQLYLFLMLEAYRSFGGKEVSPFCKAISPALAARSVVPAAARTAALSASIVDGGLAAGVMQTPAPTATPPPAATVAALSGSASASAASAAAAGAGAGSLGIGSGATVAPPADDRLAQLVSRLSVGAGGAPAAPFALPIAGATVAASGSPAVSSAGAGGSIASAALGSSPYGLSAAATSSEADMEPYNVLQTKLRQLEEARRKAQAGLL